MAAKHSARAATTAASSLHSAAYLGGDAPMHDASVRSLRTQAAAAGEPRLVQTVRGGGALLRDRRRGRALSPRRPPFFPLPRREH